MIGLCYDMYNMNRNAKTIEERQVPRGAIRRTARRLRRGRSSASVGKRVRNAVEARAESCKSKRCWHAFPKKVARLAWGNNSRPEIQPECGLIRLCAVGDLQLSHARSLGHPSLCSDRLMGAGDFRMPNVTSPHLQVSDERCSPGL